MKNAIVLCCTMIFSVSLFSQRLKPNSNSNQYRYDRLMLSAKRKQTAGTIFLAGGAIVAGGGILLISDGVRKHDNYNNGYYGYDYGTDGEVEEIAGVFATIVGVGFMAGSIPFFVGAHRSRMRAMSLSFKSESAPTLFKMSLSRQQYPALAIHIPLGR